MPYIVDRSNTYYPAITIPDATVNVIDTSLSLIGRNYPNYGQVLAENFVHMLENFSNPTPPDNPLEGQIWYNYDPLFPNVPGKLKVFDGIQWNSINVVFQSTTTALTITPDVGDLLVVTNVADPAFNQIKVWNGAWYEPANVALVSGTITSQTEETTATSNAYLVVSDGNSLYKITKSNFLADSVTPALNKTGMMTLWPFSVSVPSGWLLCDGTGYSTTAFPNLYNVLGLAFNPAIYIPGQFHVPNLVGPTALTTASTTTTYYIIKT